MDMNDSQRIEAPREVVWAALNDTAGASKVMASCGQKPDIASRNSARSATLRAIGPCTDCGE